MNANRSVNVEVKPTDEGEIEAIFALRRDPDVLREQTRPGFFETPEKFAKRLRQGPNFLGITFRCSSIYVDKQLVGHILQSFGRGADGRQPTCECGWNLARSHWGHGIMPEALRQLFTERFADSPELLLHATCFRSNHRCRRVMEKLGFLPDKLGWAVRLAFLVSGRGRRVQAYYLNRAGFCRRMTDGAQPIQAADGTEG